VLALAKTLLLAVAIGYVAIAAFLWIAQERMMFLAPRATARPSAPPGWRLETVSFRSSDGTLLAGILVMPPQQKPPLVIYYGGNAEEVTAFGPYVNETHGEAATLLVNYRGYGASGGRPGEKELVADALELFDWAKARGDLDTSRIALHGRSLGSGVAVAVAASRPATCIVLTTPFDSALEVAARMYPWLPVAWLMRHPFDSVALAPRIRIPALVLIGEADNLIPRRHSERLADHWGGPVERRYFAGFGHNDLDLHPGYAAAIRDFLGRCG
jgi:fermentation-respiration switch protein FrsA (DUF1100 family)